MTKETDMLTKQPEPNWIKCSESLPKENDLYIVTCDNGHSKWSDAAEYSKRHGGWRYGLHSDDIIAWAPFPEPYQENITGQMPKKVCTEKDQTDVPKEQTGRWISKEEGKYTCSVCGKTIITKADAGKPTNSFVG